MSIPSEDDVFRTICGSHLIGTVLAVGIDHHDLLESTELLKGLRKGLRVILDWEDPVTGIFFKFNSSRSLWQNGCEPTITSAEGGSVE